MAQKNGAGGFEFAGEDMHMTLPTGYAIYVCHHNLR